MTLAQGKEKKRGTDSKFSLGQQIDASQGIDDLSHLQNLRKGLSSETAMQFYKLNSLVMHSTIDLSTYCDNPGKPGA